MTYSIIRYNFNAENEVIERGVSLEDAQEHCNREDTHGEGWFDGYTEDDPYDEPPGAGADPFGRPDPRTHPEYWTE